MYKNKTNYIILLNIKRNKNAESKEQNIANRTYMEKEKPLKVKCEERNLQNLGDQVVNTESLLRVDPSYLHPLPSWSLGHPACSVLKFFAGGA